MSLSPIAAGVRDGAERLVTRLLGKPTGRSRRELRFRQKGSLAVVVDGPKRGLWFDHEASEGGDLIDLVIRETGLDFAGALDWCGGTAGTSGRSAQPPRRQAPIDEAGDLRRRVEHARFIYESSRDISGTLAGIYLTETRALSVPGDIAKDVLRFAPEICWRGGLERRRAPALVALFRDLFSDKPCGIRCTPLTKDGRKLRDPLMFGRTKFAAIKLTPDDGVITGLGITEGVETALRIIATGFRPVWALGSAGSMKSFPPLNGIEALTIFADHDRPDAKGLAAGIAAAVHCKERWVAADREVTVFTPFRQGDDWDDALRRVS